MSLNYHFEKKQDVLLIRLNGELDHHHAIALRKEWEKQLKLDDVKHVVINLEKLVFMDSSGLGVFLGRYKQIKEKRGEMIVCGVRPTVERLFELSGLYKLVGRAPDEPSAFKHLGVAS
ncbi:anti-sigma F factor antagonist [Halalkalibacillus halophilus]|uniref:anti-sigma F factor antagonist n=1 Tax=Halalkalibacillus halophilus TaxID=392827 RepID=UPI00041458F4|nr:anti-sigma F factor antagonist [Halalkalibacillus halophilus]